LKHQTVTPPGTRRKRQKADTQALILDTARTLFETHGFKGTTMRALAGKAGVALGTIGAHFTDKESLLVAVLVDDLERIQKKALDALPEEAPLEDRFLHLARAGYVFWGKRPGLSRVLLKEMWFLQGPWAERMRALDHQAVEQHAEWLRSAQERGFVRGEADVQLAARTGFAFYLTTILSALDSPSYDVEKMVEDTRRFLQQLFDGIGAER
jgi:AcrR family transcriptional regulator